MNQFTKYDALSDRISIGKIIYNYYYIDKLAKNQKELLEWTAKTLNFSRTTTYEHIKLYETHMKLLSGQLIYNYELPKYVVHYILLSNRDLGKLDIAKIWLEATIIFGENITTKQLKKLLQNKIKNV